MMQSVRSFAPPPFARDAIAAIVVVRLGEPGAFPLGAMMAQINWVAAGTLTYPCADGTIRAGQAAVIGPMSRAATAQVTAPFVMVGAKLLPLGWLRLMRADAACLTDGCATLADLSPAIADVRLDPAWHDAKLAHHVGQAIGAVFHTASPREDRLLQPRLAALDRWAASAVDDLGGLRATLHLGDRQLTRFTRQVLGLSPGLLVRRTRALRAAAALSQQPSPADGVAIPAGYADQPHFIREFRRFTGMTPGAFAAQLADRRTLVLRERWFDDSESELGRLG